MNVYDPYPETIEHKGRTVRLNLAYDRVLMVLDAQDDKSLLPEDRIEVQISLLLADGEKPPKSTQERVELLTDIFDLFPKEDGHTAQNERYIDLHQDAAKIRSAFFRIGVDLTKQKIHFFQFLELLRDLPMDTALMRTIEIRMKPLPKPDGHNAEQIAALAKAKAEVAIRYSEEESRKRFAEALKNSSLLQGR